MYVESSTMSERTGSYQEDDVAQFGRSAKEYLPYIEHMKISLRAHYHLGRCVCASIAQLSLRVS